MLVYCVYDATNNKRQEYIYFTFDRQDALDEPYLNYCKHLTRYEQQRMKSSKGYYVVEGYDIEVLPGEKAESAFRRVAKEHDIHMDDSNVVFCEVFTYDDLKSREDANRKED